MKRLTGYLKEKRGMTLVETLTALTILALIIFCFAPLYLSYFNTIKISGNKLKATYTEAGKLQSLIGGKGTGANSGYESNVSSIPLVFNSPETVVTEGSVTETIHQTSVAVKTAANPGGQIDPIGGSFIFSNPTDIKAGFSTIYTNSINSNIKCFPTSLTDDFIKAYITIVADGFNFSNDNMDDLNAYSLYCTKAKADGKSSELKQLVFNKDYKLERVEGTQNILLLTLYGGTDVSYENSPLVFNYNNGAYTKEIEVDAPTMIMVGEKATDGKYYYYVSRGEVDDDGNLIILRRTMNSKDPETGETITLNSAMNDVEWVPADSGDGNNVDSKGNKYGYYVMCGDNGQIRRFWRNKATGNYYWGGDYTYDTAIEIKRVDPNNKSFSFNSVLKRSTAVNYKYSFQAGTKASTDNNGKPYQIKKPGKLYEEDFLNGYNLATNKSNYLQSAHICTVNAGDNMYFYASDGKVVSYQIKKKKNWVYLPFDAFTQIYGNGSGNGIDYSSYDGIPIRRQVKIYNNLEDYAWIKPNGKTYSEGYEYLNEVSSDYNPITLTSVDAIVISEKITSANSNVKEGPYLSGIEGASSTHYYGDNWTDIDYPDSNYTLYCGYIPAAMDLWQVTTGFNQNFSGDRNSKDGAMAMTGVGYKGGTVGKSLSTLSKFNRLDTSVASSGTERYAYWRGNFGLSPYIVSGTKSGSGSFQASLNHVIDSASENNRVYYAENSWDYDKEAILFYPYDNMSYAITGKVYDSTTTVGSDDIKKNNALIQPQDLIYSTLYGKQQYITNGDVVDVTVAYLSHPFAVHISANPTDDEVYDLSNDKKNQIFYFNNCRETVTYLDCASTVIPNGEKDIPVSLMVGYVQGGVVQYGGDDLYVNTFMNNGIVMIRAGTTYVGNQNSYNSKTEEFYAKDNTGYKLNAESNVFHQFYYLNSKTTQSTDPSEGTHIGDLYGANYWQNNRHIDYISMDGGEPDQNDALHKLTGSYNYLRCHPMSNTKVNCVAWGTTWNNNPEAMWGTENGTVLSWFVDLKKAKNGSVNDWGDKSVDAELQSYKWIDNVNGKTFAVGGNAYKGTVGSAVPNSGSATGTIFSPSKDSYNEFFDKGSRDLGVRSSIGVISVLDSINDVAYDNDVWVAGGDQSGKAPETYCGQGSVTYGGENVTAFTSRGNGSWIYVRYWVDTAGDNTQSDSNSNYLWKAVKISNEAYHNVVQVNNINGMWIATGYIDSNHNGEQDDGERTVVSWATDPLVDVDGHKNHNDSTKYAGGWSDKAVFLEYNGNGGYDDVTNTVGGINSVATRS